MCDCYAPKCQDPNCNVCLEIHLRDYDTGRDEIEVYCGSHIPKNTDDGVLWKISQGKSHSKIFIRALTVNARKNWDGNHPNIAEPFQEIRVFGLKPNKSIDKVMTNYAKGIASKPVNIKKLKKLLKK